MKRRLILLFLLAEIFIGGKLFGEIISAMPAVPDIRIEPTALTFSNQAGASGASTEAHPLEVTLNSRAESVPGEAIVKFRSNIKWSEEGVIPHTSPLGRTFRALRVQGMDAIFASMDEPVGEIYRLHFAPDTPIDDALDKLANSPEVEWVEPNYIAHGAASPDDAGFPNQWGLAKVQAESAWRIETGNPNIVIAVIDTGVDYQHPDLKANIWHNPGEIPGNRIDDDGNGYVDDDIGWDFVSAVYGGASDEDVGPQDSDPMDVHGHGTHISGIIGASANNRLGVAGLAWNCKIMGVRAGFKKADGRSWFYYSDAASALVYAVDNGAQVINMSWGGSEPSNLLKSAIDYASSRGVVLVAAAENESTSTPHYPAAYPNVIAVAASDQNDRRASFSNYGSWIDLAAPGVDIYSTVPGNAYEYWKGTSMAAPFVAGLAGLIRSQNPLLTPDQVKARLIETADDVGWAKRINAYRALSSGENTFIVYNDGDGELNVTGIVPVSGSAWLSVETATPFTVAPGASKPVAISVNPNGVSSGTYADRLQVISNDPDDSPYVKGVDITLEVESISPQITSCTAAPNPVPSNQTSTLIAITTGTNKDELTFSWEAALGKIVGGGDVAVYHPPIVSVRTADIVTVRVADAFGQSDFLSVTVVVEPETRIRYGDLDGDRAVTEQDAQLILGGIVGNISLTDAQATAGDVNGNGKLTVVDAVLIFQYVAGRIPGFPVERSNGGLSVGEPAQQTFHLIIPDQNVASGKIVKLPLIVEESVDLFAGDLTVTYHPRLVTPIHVSTTDATSDCQVVYRIDDGQLHIAFANRAMGDVPRQSGAGKAAILMVEWKATTRIQKEWLSPIVLSEVHLNEQAAVTVQNGTITIHPDGTRLWQNYPNPFNPETWIPYQLAADAPVTVDIFDASGQLVRALDIGFRAAGFYVTPERSAYWNGRNQFGEPVSSGLYFYRLTGGDTTTTRKMVILR